MKKVLLTLLLAASAASSYAQGTIQFANIFGTTAARSFLAPIYAADPLNPTREQHGNSATGVPVGTTVYGGGILNVAGYSLGLFKGETMIASADLRTSATGALPAGTIAVITATVPQNDPGTTAQLTVRAWQTSFGSYANARAQGGFAGSSEVFTTAKLGGIDPTDGSIVSVPNSIGWTSFNVYTTVPEPSTIALGVLGLGSLLLFRRRQAK
jgi:hypothetical protein